jgi:hypothetical protein
MEETEKKEFYMNYSDILKDVELLIYSPCITVGLNIFQNFNDVVFIALEKPISI